MGWATFCKAKFRVSLGEKGRESPQLHLTWLERRCQRDLRTDAEFPILGNLVCKEHIEYVVLITHKLKIAIKASKYFLPPSSHYKL